MSKVILITGTSSGFGKSIAEKLHSLGYIVIGTSRNADNIKSDYLTISLDINDYKLTKQLIAKVTNTHGKIDILINNAGINITGPLESIEISDVKKVFETNFFSHLNVIQSVLPDMRLNRSGLIINITSIAAYLGLPFWGAYCASKASFNVIAESLNIELKKFNVNVVNIAPGDYKTEILRNRLDSSIANNSPYYKEYNKVINSVNAKMEHGRNPDEVADLVLKIIKQKNPKINYLVGGFLEKKITLKSLFPDKFFQKIIMNLYK